ncbi:MAG: dihydropteroate synthase [Oscillospiraceae bacterium]|nr:dihydropteroate synthase [Oscillospiraceae bacterium]
MLIIGEKLNSSVPSAQKAFQEMDADYIKNMALRQTDCGADYLDLNAGMFADETEKLIWAAEQVQSVCKTPLVLDSVNPAAIAAVLKRLELERPIINSITLEPARFEGMLPLVQQAGAGVIALPMDENGIPKDAERRVENARRVIARLEENGVGQDRIYIDLIVEALSTDSGAAVHSLKAAAQLRAEYPDVHLVGGMSNVSFGLPKRRYVNAAFLAAAVCAGLDAAIMDVTSTEAKMALLAAELVGGRDEFCMEYLSGYRETQKD